MRKGHCYVGDRDMFIETKRSSIHVPVRTISYWDLFTDDLIIGAFIIIPLVTVLVIQFKGKQFIRKHTVFSKRDSQMKSQRHVDTYCEIDDSDVRETDCKISSESELEVYESIDQSRKDGTNYTALPARQRDSIN